MANTHVARIDRLYEGSLVVLPIAKNDPDRDAVGAVQDLLFGLGIPGVPLFSKPNWGTFGKRTEAAVRRLQKDAGLPQTGQVDTPTLQQMAQRSHTRPRLTRAYVALQLDVEFSVWIKILSIVSIVESGGRFAGPNNNSDTQGLSWGVIQWAQKPGRLVDILQAMRDKNKNLFDQIVGGADRADKMIAHANKPNGGVDATTGETTDAAFNFIAPPWSGRFLNLGLAPELQKAQVVIAVDDFKGIRDHVNTFAAGKITSERGVAFMIDLCNQHGRTGGKSVYQAVVTDAMTEAQALAAVADESVKRLKAQYGDDSDEAKGTRARRDLFRTTDLLSDAPFTP